MSAQFKGVTVNVVLNDGSSIIGLVSDVANGQLLLSNGKLKRLYNKHEC